METKKDTPPAWMKNPQNWQLEAIRQFMNARVPTPKGSSWRYRYAAWRGFAYVDADFISLPAKSTPKLYAALAAANQELSQPSQSTPNRRLTKRDIKQMISDPARLEVRDIFMEVVWVVMNEKPRHIEEYLSGFAHGIKCFRKERERAIATGKTLPIMVTDATEIYFKLLHNVDKVESFRSTPELHKWLKDELGKKVGDLKRIEKICERFGIKFPRGRPRKK